jgi:hypothetical protein
MALGLAPDPEESIKKVHAARMQRMELVLGRQATVVLASPKEDEGEEEEEDEGKDDATEDNGDEDAEGDEGDEEGGDEEGEEEDEEEKKIEIKPLYVIATPAQGIKLSIQQMWDNFAVKAVRMTEEDDGTSSNKTLSVLDSLFISPSLLSQMKRMNKERISLEGWSCQFTTNLRLYQAKCSDNEIRWSGRCTYLFLSLSLLQ